jgi:hypothetical protein
MLMQIQSALCVLLLGFLLGTNACFIVYLFDYCSAVLLVRT